MDNHGHWDIESRISDVAGTLSYELEGERTERMRADDDLWRDLRGLSSIVDRLIDRVDALERERD